MPPQIFKHSYFPADCTYLVQFQLAEGNVSFSGFKAIRAIAVKIAVQNRVQSCLLEPKLYIPSTLSTYFIFWQSQWNLAGVEYEIMA
jgi:hypothetical protein